MHRVPILSIIGTIVTASAVAAARPAPPAAREVTHSVTLSFATQSAGHLAPHLPPSATPRTLRVAAGDDVIEITRAQIALRNIELSASGGPSCDEGTCGVASLIDLPIGATAPSSVRVRVPAGTYATFDALLTRVRVQGTFDGRPFIFETTPGAPLDLEFNPPLSVDAAGTNLTVNADVAGWFRTVSGALIDPATAIAGAPNAGAVARNIGRSFDAFEDVAR